MDSLLSHINPVKDRVINSLAALQSQYSSQLLLLPYYILLSLLTYACFALLFRFRFRSHDSVSLPPGSYGWPLIGETLQLIRSHEQFVVTRMARHSIEIFKTSVVGERAAFFCGPAGNRFIFSNYGKLVNTWWPPSVQNILPNSILTSTGHDAKLTRRLLTTFLNPEALHRYVGIMDVVAGQQLDTEWSGRREVKAFSLVKAYTFALACRLFVSIQDPDCISKMAREFNILVKGIIHIPLKFPGTPYYRAMRAADVIRKAIRTVIERRRVDLLEGRASSTQDLLSCLLVTADENGRFLSEMQIIDNIVMLIFAGHDTSSSAITMLLKCLAQMPDVYNKVLQEQREIALSKEAGELLVWEDIHKMKYSWNVASEVIRLWPPISGTFREAMAGFTYAGFTIPKGWKLHWSVNSTHKNPAYFPMPERFDPSRFEGEGPAPYTYVPFGGGPRMCPGKEYARLEILVFLHNVVKRFKWEEVFPEEKIKFSPLPVPTKGLPIRLWPHNS